MAKFTTTVPLTKVSGDRLTDMPSRFYERFGPTGEMLNPEWFRITHEDTEQLFPPREEGLRVLLINPPIREWSYPNIMPIGQGYVGAVAAMDGHHIDVLDLNAQRGQPIKGSEEAFSKWVATRIVEKLEKEKPDVIGILPQGCRPIRVYSW